MRALGMIVLAYGAAVASATAETPEPPPRDAKSWGRLIEAAKQRGGQETKLDKSSSYVFQQEDGNFLTLTEWRSPPKRFVCLIAKDQKATACVNWETGRTTYGQRADAASPWKTREATPLEQTKEPSEVEGMFGKLGGFLVESLAMKLPGPPLKEYNFYYFRK